MPTEQSSSSKLSTARSDQGRSAALPPAATARKGRLTLPPCADRPAHRPGPNWRAPWLLLPVAGLASFAALFVGFDVVISRLLPTTSTALRHALLTASAGAVTAITSAIVYFVMHRQNQRLSDTAEQLAQLISSYRSNPGEPARFENPHLVHCRDVLSCEDPGCPMFDAPGERCWQVMALNNGHHDDATPHLQLEQCLQCEVYRRSCPDKLTELGESFNNLMLLLEEEAKQVGRMRAQMVEKEKMVALGQIAAGIAHEVGNPLSSISSIVQMLRRKGADGAMTEELELIETHIQRISATVRQLVSLARPGGTRWEQVDVSRILEEAVRLISFDRRAKKVEIQWNPADRLPQTFALRGQLQQVFINLALNALDAMPDGGKLTIRAYARRPNIVVRIEDTGCGIPPKIGRRVFDPFFTTKEPGEGTGLGLAVSYTIVQKHGGEIDFSSTEGQGTVFTVEIPVLNDAPGT